MGFLPINFFRCICHTVVKKLVRFYSCTMNDGNEEQKKLWTKTTNMRRFVFSTRVRVFHAWVFSIFFPRLCVSLCPQFPLFVEFGFFNLHLTVMSNDKLFHVYDIFFFSFHNFRHVNNNNTMKANTVRIFTLKAAATTKHSITTIHRSQIKIERHFINNDVLLLARRDWASSSSSSTEYNVEPTAQ